MVAAGQQNRLTAGIFSQQRQRGAHIPDFPAAADGQHGDAHLLIFRVLGQIQGVGEKRTVNLRGDISGIRRHALGLSRGKMPVPPLKPHQPAPFQRRAGQSSQPAVGCHRLFPGIHPGAEKYSAGEEVWGLAQQQHSQLCPQGVPHHGGLFQTQGRNQLQQRLHGFLRTIDQARVFTRPRQMGDDQVVFFSQIILLAEGVQGGGPMEQKQGRGTGIAVFVIVQHQAPPFPISPKKLSIIIAQGKSLEKVKLS